MPRLTPTERYWAHIVIKARDGDSEALQTMGECPPTCPPELIEWYLLCMDLSILCDSPEAARLSELDDKYESEETYATEVW